MGIKKATTTSTITALGLCYVKDKFYFYDIFLTVQRKRHSICKKLLLGWACNGIIPSDKWLCYFIFLVIEYVAICERNMIWVTGTDKEPIIKTQKKQKNIN